MNEMLLDCNKEMISKFNEINLVLPVSSNVLNKLKDVNDECEIRMNFNEMNFLDEKKYYIDLINTLNELNKHNKKYNIIMFINNRKIFSESNLLNKKYNNINLIINNESDYYTIDEYIDNDSKLDKLLENIKGKKLSPLERYIYVYNIVRKFKPYKQEPKGSDIRLSRNLKYILDNDYLVCVGYSRLLNVLLNKVGISSCDYILKVYEQKENKDTNYFNETNHQRNIVYLDDNKYNVHGFYLSDATFDNTFGKSVYNHALMTFDKNKETVVYQSLVFIDCFFDFHNKEEYYNKINYYIRRYKKDYRSNNDIFRMVFAELLKYLYRLDYNYYTYLYQKYNKLNYSNDIETNDNEDLQDIYLSMLDDYYEYAIKRVNNNISNEKILDAFYNAKVILNEIPEEYASKIKEMLIDYNNEREKRYFPFDYDSFNNEVDYKDYISKKR
jgi:hypothetical protein